MLKKFTNFVRSCLILSEEEKARACADILYDDIVILRCVKLDGSAQVPTKAHTGLFEDAAYDLYAPAKETGTRLLQPTTQQMVGTKLSFIIPNGYWLKLRERSGLATKGIHVLGGVIDCGYTGEVKVILYNSSKEPVSIPTDKAICQFTVERLSKSCIEELTSSEFEELTAKRQRGEKGFGSSDK